MFFFYWSKNFSYHRGCNNTSPAVSHRHHANNLYVLTVPVGMERKFQSVQAVNWIWVDSTTRNIRVLGHYRNYSELYASIIIHSARFSSFRLRRCGDIMQTTGIHRRNWLSKGARGSEAVIPVIETRIFSDLSVHHDGGDYRRGFFNL